jgi:peptidoglycan hydrolase-like protein with peptidoglycan-binding domain
MSRLPFPNSGLASRVSDSYGKIPFTVELPILYLDAFKMPQPRRIMSKEHNSSAQQVVTGFRPSAIPSRSRRLRRFGTVAVIVVALLGLLFFYAPRYVARYLVSSTLDDLGIDYEGVETLDINPWTRELWLGPVRFGVGPSDRGQLGELGLTIRFNPLLEQRISIERLLLRGIDVIVTRSKDNARRLNGIPLEQFIRSPDAHEQSAEEGDAWRVGVDTLELRDSRLIFQDRERGELEVDIERLTLMEFQTWEPDRPGRFELAARVNDIQLNWSGEARPFADNVTFAIDSHTEQADVPKLVRFTGPWGLDRRQGSYDARLKYEVTLFHSGRTEGHTVGSIDINGADYERAGVFSLALERAKVDLDLRYTWSESGDFRLQGQVAADLGRSSFELADKTRLAVAAGRVAMSGLDTAYAKNGSLRFGVRPEIDMEGVVFSGPIEISAGKLLELVALLQSLSAAGAVSTADTGLGDYAGSSISVPSSDVKIGRMRSKGEKFSLKSIEGRVELGLKTDTELLDIHIGVNDKNINIKRLQSVIERLSVTSGQGRLAVEMAGGNSLTTGTAEGPRGELKIGALESKLGQLDLQAQTGAVSLQLAAAGRATGFSGLIYGRQTLPEVQLHVGAASAALSRASLDVAGGALRWQAAGDTGVDALSVDFAKGKEGVFKLSRARIAALKANERLELAADTLTVNGLDLYVKRSFLTALLGDGDAAAEKAAPSKQAEAKPGVVAPAAVQKRLAQKVYVSRVQTLLTKLGYAPGVVDGHMGRRTAAAIKDFQRQEAMAVDGQLTGGLLAALESRAAGPAESDAASASPADVAMPKGVSVRLGRISLTGSSVLRFRDDMVTPQVNVDTVFKRAEVQNLDTRKVDGRTDLSLVADVNEFTHVELAGWIAGLGETADLDVKAKVENLELSTYSPYVAEIAGVHLESGQLDTETTVTAKQGVLQGKIQLELDDMVFRSLSKEEAERVSGTIGVPLETAVSLLQDSQGRISLTLPVGGALSKPEVDISSAVSKAIGSVLISVFPPAMVASMMEGVAKGSGPTFEPIEFAQGSAELDKAGRQRADAVAKLLAEHPKLSLKVCGRSTAQDMEQFMPEAGAAVPPAVDGKELTGQSKAEPAADPAQTEQTLIELAIERMRVVRRYLIRKKGADAKHLPECRSTFQPTDQGGPRVEISFSEAVGLQR